MLKNKINDHQFSISCLLGYGV